MLYYLASPYSHKDEKVRQERYELACKATAELLDMGYRVFSPIVHSHPLVAYGLPSDSEFWLDQDLRLLERCDRLLILEIDGWDISEGVQQEIDRANERGMLIEFYEMGESDE